MENEFQSNINLLLFRSLNIGTKLCFVSMIKTPITEFIITTQHTQNRKEGICDSLFRSSIETQIERRWKQIENPNHQETDMRRRFQDLRLRRGPTATTPSILHPQLSLISLLLSPIPRSLGSPSHPSALHFPSPLPPILFQSHSLPSALLLRDRLSLSLLLKLCLSPAAQEPILCILSTETKLDMRNRGPPFFPLPIGFGFGVGVMCGSNCKRFWVWIWIVAEVSHMFLGLRLNFSLNA